MESSRSGSPLLIGGVAALLAALYFVAWISWIPQPTAQFFPPDQEHGFATIYDPPQRPIEVAANSGDGQAFAALASDPTLSRPDLFHRGEAEAAYRWQRPLAGYAAWALSLGQPGPVPWALGALAVLGVGLFAAATATLAKGMGRDPRLAVLLVAAPGVVADLRWMCPDVLAAGLGLWGLVLWMRRPERPWAAVALFTLAVLTRETLLVVPLVVGIDGLLNRVPLRRLLPLGVVPVSLAAWILLVHERIGAWPSDAAGDGRLTLPFVGMVQGLSDASPLTLISIAVTFGLAAVALAHRPDPLIRRVIVGHLVLASVMGDTVWEIWFGVGRVMLPMIGIALATAMPTLPVAVPLGERDGPGASPVPPVPVRS